MRRLILAGAAAAVLLVPTFAQAATEVRVSIGAPLAQKADDYGPRDLDYLRDRLGEAVTRAADRNPSLADARFDLVLVDAKPNHPTTRQLTRTPGLSLESLSIGGATIAGEVTLRDGSRHAVAYDRYTDTLMEVGAATTWTDANRTFSDFARRVADGRL